MVQQIVEGFGYLRELVVPWGPFGFGSFGCYRAFGII